MIMLASGVVGVLLLLSFIGFAMARLYQKATPELSLVKTGSGKGKAIINGGTIVIPIFHEVMRVGMKTLKIDVRQSGENAFITKDHRRADIDTEFYIRVKPDERSVMTAAQTLGAATRDPRELLPFVEGKLVNALRSAAAGMTLMELHERRDQFVERVQNAVASDLEQNGLELESAALTSLDQTPLEQLKETNVFDAEGMRAISEIINKKKEERSKVDEATRVIIANQKKDADLEVIQSERLTEEARIHKDRQISEKDSESQAAIREAQESSQRRADEARIDREKTIEAADVEKRKAVKLADYAAEKETAEASKEVSAMEAEAAEARKVKVVAEEEVRTAEAVAAAERAKRIDIIDAEREAEVNAASIRITAEVEKQAEADRADALRIAAQARADADQLEATGIIAKGRAQAEAEQLLNEARNKLSPEIITYETQKLTIERMPDIIREIAKPAEKIDSITVLSGGFPGAGTVAAGSETNGNLMEDLFSAMRRHQVSMPIIEKMVKGLGVSNPDSLISEIEKYVSTGRSGNGHDPEGEASIIDRDYDHVQ